MESYCISCKRSLSIQLALYQCRCCLIRMCPDCVCAARISTTSLTRLSDAQLGEEATPEAVSQSLAGPPPQAAPNKLQAQSNKSVKRKPLSNTDGVFFTQVAHQPSQSTLMRVKTEEDQPIQQQASPVQAPPHPILLPNDEYISPSTTTTLYTDVRTTTAPVQNFVYPVHVENPSRTLSPNSQIESSAVPFPQHPPLRHAQTTPQPTLRELENDKIQRCSTSQPLSQFPIAKSSDRRKSASQLWSSSLETGKRLGSSSLETGKRLSSSSLETGKKLAKNKYVRAGVKYTADLAMRTVVNGVITEVLNNNNDNSDSSNNNNGQPSDDIGSGMFDQFFNSPTDGTTYSSTDPQTSQVDLSGLLSPGLAFPVTALGNFANTNNIAMDPFQQLQQQQQAAALGLNMALQQQNAAVAASAQSAIQQSQQFQSDMQFQASKTLDWGTNATVPGVTANRYRTTASTTNNKTSGLTANFQQQLTNAGAAV